MQYRRVATLQQMISLILIILKSCYFSPMLYFEIVFSNFLT